MKNNFLSIGSKGHTWNIQEALNLAQNLKMTD